MYSELPNYTPLLVHKNIPNNTQALIIDDEVDICYLLRNILRQKKINADYVTSLAEAENYLHEYDPPIIFLDNYLSDGLGVNHIRSFKEEHPGATIIIITAHDNITDRDKAYREGADFFISKPFTRESIFKTLENV